METLTGTLLERVHASLRRDEPIEWGHSRLSTTPTVMAMDHLAGKLAGAEQALVEISLDVQALARQVEALTEQLAALDR